MKETARLPGICLILVSLSAVLQGQPYKADWNSLDKRPIPSWFHEAKFGIFIHWGVYAVPSYSPVVPDGYSEWYWRNLEDPERKNHAAVKAFHDRVYGNDFTYEQFLPMFKAELFDSDEWAELFKNSGAKYVVLTSKHHDGFCLWPNEEANESWGRPWNAASAGPHRDILGDLTTSVRQAGLKMGYYYSLMEWYNPVFEKNRSNYVDEVMIPQFKDLVTRYKPSVIFSDGEWIMEDTDWKSPEILAWLFNDSPVANEVVVNDRWGKNTRSKHPCTYFTSEYGSGMDKSVVWEENRGMGQSYGYNRMERLGDYKTSDELIIILADIVSRGGNLLLDIGPATDGTIPVIMEERLRDMGKWLDVNGEAIYNTRAWKRSKQWSEGEKPEIESGNYQTNYDVNELVKANGDQARIEMFFTRKDNTLYCIIPQWSRSFKIRDVSIGSHTSVSIPGLDKAIHWQKDGKDIIVDLSGIHPGDLTEKLFVVKITGLRNLPL